jgi:hypothetical protein
MSDAPPNRSTADDDLPLSTELQSQQIALIELYQRQDAMSSQLWQQFIFANIATIAVVVLITVKYSGKWVSPPLLDIMFRLDYALSLAVLIIWSTYTYGNMSALGNSQMILRRIGYQIERDLADQITLFTDATKRAAEVRLFHVIVDIGIIVLCVLLLFFPTGL